MASLLDRYHNNICGVLSFFDRVIIQGTLPGLCYAAGMTTFLHLQRIRIFDYAKFAEPLRDQIRSHAEAVAEKHGLTIEFIRKLKQFRKEDRIQTILQQLGRHPWLVKIFSAIETCPSYKPWHDKTSSKTFLKPDSGKCLHYYFYFINTQLGLCYLRVPTWCPFRLQFYCNGHNWLGSQLENKGIAFELTDKTFTKLPNFPHAQCLADGRKISTLHRALDQFVTEYCPILKTLDSQYHWSLMQVEYPTNILFTTPAALHDLYQILSQTAIHSVKADNVAPSWAVSCPGGMTGHLGPPLPPASKHPDQTLHGASEPETQCQVLTHPPG